MDVARPRLDRLVENLVHQPDDRGLLDHLRRLGLVPVDLLEHLDAAVALLVLRHQAVDRLGADAQVGLDQLGQFVGQGQHRQHALAGGGADGVQGVQIERIAGGHHQRTLLDAGSGRCRGGESA